MIWKGEGAYLERLWEFLRRFILQRASPGIHLFMLYTPLRSIRHIMGWEKGGVDFVAHPLINKGYQLTLDCQARRRHSPVLMLWSLFWQSLFFNKKTYTTSNDFSLWVSAKFTCRHNQPNLTTLAIIDFLERKFEQPWSYASRRNSELHYKEGLATVSCLVEHCK